MIEGKLYNQDYTYPSLYGKRRSKIGICATLSEKEPFFGQIQM